MILKVPRTWNNEACSETLHFSQPWQPFFDPEFKPATVRLSWTPQALVIKAVLRDDEISSLATADSQKLWKMGDVFEIFVQVEGRADYVEMHITPNNRRTHLNLPGPDGRPSPNADMLTWETMVVKPVGFSSEVTRSDHEWRVSASIPAATLGLAGFNCGDSLRVSFCRYDYASNRELILSTTSKHPSIAFHRPDEWPAVKLTD
ncbi:MAG: hypothetical protein WCG03_00415 [Kiritimatiellales bacterium]